MVIVSTDISRQGRSLVVAAVMCAAIPAVSGCNGSSPGLSSPPSTGSTSDKIVTGADPFALAAESPAPCQGGFNIDMVGAPKGWASADEALAQWLAGNDTETGAAPSETPRDGWSHVKTSQESVTYAAGSWTATAISSGAGSWLVVRLTCS